MQTSDDVIRIRCKFSNLMYSLWKGQNPDSPVLHCIASTTSNAVRNVYVVALKRRILNPSDGANMSTFNNFNFVECLCHHQHNIKAAKIMSESWLALSSLIRTSRRQPASSSSQFEYIMKNNSKNVPYFCQVGPCTHRKALKSYAYLAHNIGTSCLATCLNCPGSCAVCTECTYAAQLLFMAT